MRSLHVIIDPAVLLPGCVELRSACIYVIPIYLYQYIVNSNDNLYDEFDEVQPTCCMTYLPKIKKDKERKKEAMNEKCSCKYNTYVMYIHYIWIIHSFPYPCCFFFFIIIQISMNYHACPFREDHVQLAELSYIDR